MPEPVYRPDIGTEIRTLRKTADQAWVAARRRPGLRTIAGLFRVLAGGHLTAENATEVPVVSIGTFTRNSGRQMTGLMVRRSGGQEAFIAGHYDENDFMLRMLDENQAVVISPSVDGLRRPYLPVTFARAQADGWAAASTTWAVVFIARFYRQHSHLTVVVGYSNSAGDLSISLVDDQTGETVAQQVVSGSVPLDEISWTVPIGGAHMDLKSMSVWCHTTSGPAYLQVYSAYSTPLED